MTMNTMLSLLLLLFIINVQFPSVNGFAVPAPQSVATSRITLLTTPPSRPEATQQSYEWNGHRIHTERYGKQNGQPVILVHGFGCSTTYWRETIKQLTEENYDVHAIDLLGQGKSSKPADVYYSINLWASLVDDYAKDVVAKQSLSSGNLLDNLLGGVSKNKEILLMGNSLGSLVCLAAAVGDHSDNDSAFLPGNVRGITMFNCGVGLNSRGIIDEPQWSPFQRFLFTAVLNTLDALLFNNPPVLNYVLGTVVTPELLQGALEGLYKYDPSRVDEELVQSFYQPAKDDGAPDALRQIYTNDPGLSPMQIHEKHNERVKDLPIHLVWGDDDGVTPLSGGVGTFYSELASDASTPVTMDIIGGTGHVPFDDNPIESNQSMLKWLKTF